MTPRLVTEARPLLWSQLSEFEKKQLRSANDWIKAVIDDAESRKPTDSEIELARSGRVLFIDGARGAGKTSMLLTLLQLLNGQQKVKPKEPEPELVVLTDKIHVFLPVLDFDPLPRGMSLQGWLLEPWRGLAEQLDKKGKGPSDSVDLTEQFASLFERAIIGWTSAQTEGQGVVEKSLSYQQQASGWLETKKKWRDFVGAMVCQWCGCSDRKCTGHRFVFVVAIDDVDLQVEHLPQLLHAIRLFHHPNVAYILTGNMDHLRFVLELDYIRRHELRAHPHHHRDDGPKDVLSLEIQKHSRTLRDAFLEKALPKSAQIALPYLKLDEVLSFPVDSKAESVRHVRDTLHEPTLKVLLKASHLKIVTARQAQHAVDRHLEHMGGNAAGIAETHRFVADLCNTEIESRGEQKQEPDSKKDPDSKDPTELTIRGELTTTLGKTLKVWKGDNLKLVLSDQPAFEFFPEFGDEPTPLREDAHRALLIQLLAEQENAPIVAYGLEWAPVAGVMTTQVKWKPKSNKVDPTAIFHWPWLQVPSAAEVLEFGKLSAELRRAADGKSLADPQTELLAEWLLKNLDWRLNASLRNGKKLDREKLPRLNAKSENFLKVFSKCLKDLSESNDEMKAEVRRWALELYVMTAPYFGLATELAKVLREAVRETVKELTGKDFTEKEISDEQNKMVQNAIIESRDDGVNSPELDSLAKEFLAERYSRLDDAEKPLWIKSVSEAGSPSSQEPPTQTAKSL